MARPSTTMTTTTKASQPCWSSPRGFSKLFTLSTFFTLLFVLLSSVVSSVAAQTGTTTPHPSATSTIPPGSPTIPKLPDSATTGRVVEAVGKAITPASVIAAIICISVGFFLCFAGYRFFRPTLFVAGFGLFGLLAFFICMMAAPLNGGEFDGTKRTIFLVIIIAVGLFGGFLAVCLWRFGLMLVGALGGFVGALFILAWAPTGLIHDNIWRALFIVILSVVGVVLIFAIERPAVIIATSIAGGFGIALGIDFFVRSAFISSIAAFLGGSSNAIYSADTKTYIMLSLVAILSFLGMFVQFRFYKGLFRSHKSATRPSNKASHA